MIPVKEIWKTPQLKKIMSGSELLLFYETDKYAKYYLNEGVELGDVTILKRLQYSTHFSFLMHKGYKLDSEVKEEDLVEYNPKYYFEDRLKDITMTETEDSYIFNWMADKRANLVLHGMNRSAAYISLFALVLVLNYMNKTNKQLYIQQGNYMEDEFEYDDLFILKKYGNKLFDDSRLLLETSLLNIKTTECNAYFSYQKQLGYMLAPVPTQTKYRVAKKFMNVGDVMLLYKKNKNGIIEHCFPAVILGYTEEHITLIYYPIVETLLTRKIKLKKLKESSEKCVYTFDDYMSFTGCRVQEEWDKIGVGYAAYDESLLLLTPFRDDMTYQYFRYSDTQVCSVPCDTIETIYAVFEDRGVDYNKEAFLKKYYNGEEPIYDRFRKMGYDQRS